MPEETRPHRPFTPKPDRITQRRYRRGVSCASARLSYPAAYAYLHTTRLTPDEAAAKVHPVQAVLGRIHVPDVSSTPPFRAVDI